MTDTLLVTGSEGFAGKALCRRLERDCRVLRSSRSLGHDLLSEGALDPFEKEGPRTVLHLAGATSAPLSWERPALFYQTNVLGTQRVLEFCRKTGAGMVYISSCVYGKPQYLPMDERHPVAPANPYTHSKWLGEELCRFYERSFGVPLTVLRPFNLYGPHQGGHFLIPSVIRQYLETGRVVVDDLRPRRDFLHVDDFAEACATVQRLPFQGEVFNVGSGTSRSITEVLDTIARVGGRPMKRESRNKPRPDEILEIVAQCRLTIQGEWKPRISFEEGIADVIKSFSLTEGQ